VYVHICFLQYWVQFAMTSDDFLLYSASVTVISPVERASITFFLPSFLPCLLQQLQFAVHHQLNPLPFLFPLPHMRCILSDPCVRHANRSFKESELAGAGTGEGLRSTGRGRTGPCQVALPDHCFGNCCCHPVSLLIRLRQGKKAFH